MEKLYHIYAYFDNGNGGYDREEIAAATTNHVIWVLKKGGFIKEWNAQNNNKVSKIEIVEEE